MPDRFCPHCGAPMAATAVICPQCKMSAFVKPAGQKSRSWRDPVVLIIAGCGCLALVAFAGIVAAILIPNFVDALHTGRQKRTAIDLRTMAATLMATSGGGEEGYPETGSFVELKVKLGAAAADWPETDAWDHGYRYQCWAERAASGCDTFRLASPGRDGFLESEDLRELTQGSFLDTDYDSDLVIAEFGWVRVPSKIEDAPAIEEEPSGDDETEPEALGDSDDAGPPGAAPEGEDAGDGQD